MSVSLDEHKLRSSMAGHQRTYRPSAVAATSMSRDPYIHRCIGKHNSHVDIMFVSFFLCTTCFGCLSSWGASETDTITHIKPIVTRDRTSSVNMAPYGDRRWGKVKVCRKKLQSS
jgi:hypothetical protein